MERRRIIQTATYITLATIMLIAAGCKGKGQKEGDMDREEGNASFHIGAEKTDADGVLDLQRVNPDNLITFDIEFPEEDDIGRNGEDLSNFAEIISIIPLETTNECLIGEIDKILYADGVYCTVDRFKEREIFAFDEEGKFISRIGNFGRGPGEYIVPCDIFYDSAKGEIVVWDEIQHEFIRYSKDGEYLGDKKVDLSLEFCSYDDESGLLWFTTNNNSSLSSIADYQVIALDSTYKKIVYRVDYNPLRFNFSNIHSIQKKDGSIYYHPQLSDTIYEIKDGTITPRFTFNYKNAKTLPYNFRQECKGKYENFLKKYKTFVQFWSGFYITDRYLIARISSENIGYLAICDIENQSVRFINTQISSATQRLNDGTTSKIYIPDGIVVEGNQITLSIPLSRIKSYDNKEDPYYELSPYISTEPKDDDNPLLVTIKFKNEEE